MLDQRTSNVPVPDTDRDARAHAHSAEDAILESRRATAARVRARGENPFANDVKPKTTGAITLDVDAVRARAEDA